jgi:hypothetical protein
MTYLSAKANTNISEDSDTMPLVTEDIKAGNNELKAAAALASLVGPGKQGSGSPSDGDGDAKHATKAPERESLVTSKEKKFAIPRRLTRCGRKRAVSFPYKVSEFRGSTPFAHSFGHPIMFQHYDRDTYLCIDIYVHTYPRLLSCSIYNSLCRSFQEKSILTS